MMDITTLAAAKAYTDKRTSESGGSSLIAGDLLEIKDGVIRSTLGDSLGAETKLEILYDSGRLVLDEDDIYIDEDDIEDGKVWTEYCYMPIYQPTFLDRPENEEEIVELDVKYYPPNSDEFVVLKSLMVYYYDSHYDEHGCEIRVNVKLGEDDTEVNDPNYPMFFIYAENPYWDDDDKKINEFKIQITNTGYGAPDLSGVRIVIDREEIVEKFVALPDNALKAGKFIEIKDGQIRLTLGDKIVTEKSVNILNEEIYSMTKHETIDNLYNSEQFRDDNFPIPNTKAIIELTLANSDQVITYENIEIGEYGTNDERNNFRDYIYMIANTNQDISSIIEYNGFTEKDDDTIPALAIRGFIDTDKDCYRAYIYSSDDLSGATIKVTNNYTQTDYVKIPRGALRLDVDEEPEKESSNLITSGGVYKAIRNVKPELTFDNVPTSGSKNLVDSGAIYNAIQNIKPELTFDNVPTNGSKNLVNSGTVYTAIQKSEQKIPTAITSYINTNSNAQGASIGKKYNTMGGEIFNDYGGNVASAVYTHAEGFNTTASSVAAHAEGYDTTASGSQSHAEGCHTAASGDTSHVEGYYTIAKGRYSHVQGRCNIEDIEEKYAHIVGNGTMSVRSNAYTLDWDGNAWFAGNVEAKGVVVPGKEVITEIISGSGYSDTASIVGFNLLSLGQEYLVIYNGVEHRLICFQNTSGTDYIIGDEYTPGHELNQTEFGFRIWQYDDGSVNVATLNSSDTLSLSKIETPKIDLVSYIQELEDRIQLLEKKIN